MPTTLSHLTIAGYRDDPMPFKAAVFKLGSADQRGSATGSHGVREKIPKSSNCLHGFQHMFSNLHA